MEALGVPQKFFAFIFENGRYEGTNIKNLLSGGKATSVPMEEKRQERMLTPVLARMRVLSQTNVSGERTLSDTKDIRGDL